MHCFKQQRKKNLKCSQIHTHIWPLRTQNQQEKRTTNQNPDEIWSLTHSKQHSVLGKQNEANNDTLKQSNNFFLCRSKARKKMVENLWQSKFKKHWHWQLCWYSSAVKSTSNTNKEVNPNICNQNKQVNT